MWRYLVAVVCLLVAGRVVFEAGDQYRQAQYHLALKEAEQRTLELGKTHTAAECFVMVTLEGPGYEIQCQTW